MTLLRLRPTWSPKRVSKPFPLARHASSMGMGLRGTPSLHVCLLSREHFLDGPCHSWLRLKSQRGRGKGEDYCLRSGARRTIPFSWDGNASSKHCFPVFGVQIHGHRRGSAGFGVSGGGVGGTLTMTVTLGGDVTITGWSNPTKGTVTNCLPGATIDWRVGSLPRKGADGNGGGSWPLE